jgi:hypothetical protein
MNLPLQQRAGANVGLITSNYPRTQVVKSSTLALVLGDNLLFEGPAEGVRLVGNIALFNQNIAGNLIVQAVLKNAAGNEQVIGTKTCLIAVVAPNTETTRNFFTPTVLAAALAPGESLILRVTTAGAFVAGTAYAQAEYAELYGVQSVRAALSTSLQVVVQPPAGKSLVTLLGGDAPNFVLNYDSANHTIDVYVNDGVIDTLVYKGLFVPAGGTNSVPLPSLGAGQSLKMAMREPIATPGQLVQYGALYLLNDEI